MSEEEFKQKITFIRNCIWWIENPMKDEQGDNTIGTIDRAIKHLQELKLSIEVDGIPIANKKIE